MFVALGLAGLAFGADWLVDGAASLARRLRISALVIGLTVIAWGTSAPEIGASLVAVLRDSPGIAVGNVIGSNAANLGLILGVTAVLKAFDVGWPRIRREYWCMLLATLLLLPLALAGEVGRGWGAALVGLLLAFNLLSIRWSRDFPAPAEEDEAAGVGRSLLLVLAGLAALVVGADFLVRGASDIARGLGVSEVTVGFTVVAIGTSLPELATSVAAVRRHQIQIVVGNVIGSNLFNVLGALGVAAVASPVGVDPRVVTGEVPGVIVLTLVAGWFLWTGKRLTRTEGAALLAAYAAYVAWAIL